MDIIFLDVDGVLNNAKTLIRGKMLDDKCIIRLKTILDNTNTKLVLSSTWRLRKKNGVKLYKAFVKNGIDPKLLIGKTPNLYKRENEIYHWVENHNVNKWIAIDDISLKLPKEHFINTSFFTGLIDDDVKKAIKLLK